MTAYTIEDLIKILKTIPSSATITVNEQEGIDVFYEENENLFIIETL